MTKKQYLEKALELFESGRITSEVYGAMVINADEFVDKKEKRWRIFNKETGETLMWMFNDSAEYIEKRVKSLYGNNSAITFELDMEG